jgi:hypothetical protein
MTILLTLPEGYFLLPLLLPTECEGPVLRDSLYKMWSDSSKTISPS